MKFIEADVDDVVDGCDVDQADVDDLGDVKDVEYVM